MQEGSDFQQILQRYEDMIRKEVSYFFDIEEFEDIIDYFLDMDAFQEAYEAAEMAVRQHPGSFEIKLKKVHIHLESGKPALALEELLEFPDYESDNSEYYLLKGTSLAQLGKFREAEKVFDLAVENSNEDKVDILINISIAFENLKQYTPAIKYLKEAFALEPFNLTVLYDLGYYYERIHNFSASVDFYNKYLDIDPFSENVWYNLGVIYYKINKLEKALQAYDYAIAINPSYASAYFNKANIYANENNYVRAIKVYNDFIEVDPENLQAWCYLGECYEETGNYKKALEIYKKVIEIDNTYADGWFGAGISLMYLDKLKESASYVLKAIDFEKDNTEYWFTLGEIYEKLGFVNEARKCYTHVTGLDKTDREAWIRLAFIYLNESNLPKTLETLREAYQNNFTSQDILYMLSAVYFRAADEAAGVKFFEKAIEQGEGGRHLFFEIFPEGRYHEKIRNFLKKDL